MQEFKCRAECPLDVFQVLTELGKRRLRALDEGKAAPFITFKSINKWDDYPDCEVIFRSQLALDELKSAIRDTAVPDIHVMMETLRPIAEYTGKRL